MRPNRSFCCRSAALTLSATVVPLRARVPSRSHTLISTPEWGDATKPRLAAALRRTPAFSGCW